MSKPKRIVCPHCTWTCPLWITTKHGGKQSGERLWYAHINDKHPDVRNAMMREAEMEAILAEYEDDHDL